MRRFYFILIFGIGVLLLGLCQNGRVFAMSAKEIVEKSDQIVRGNSSVGMYEITIKTRRWTRTMKMKSFEERKERKSLAEIFAPKKDAGNRFLLMGDRMWQFVPKLQRIIKIAPSMMMESWMGSDFSNDDIVKESSIINDYTHKMLGREIVAGDECYKIELQPKPDAAVVWGKIIYYARVKDYLPLREEFYNEHDVLKKVMTCSNIKDMGGRFIPTVYKMQTLRKKDRYTLMEIKKVRFDIPIPERVFTLQYLKRR